MISLYGIMLPFLIQI